MTPSFYNNMIKIFHIWNKFNVFSFIKLHLKMAAFWAIAVLMMQAVQTSETLVN
jgi:hypothetical protein